MLEVGLLCAVLQFIRKLLAERGREVQDPITRSLHAIEPQTLAHRILQVRPGGLGTLLACVMLLRKQAPGCACPMRQPE